MTLYFLFLSLLSHRLSAVIDKLRLAGCLFLASKVLQTSSDSADTLSRQFRVSVAEVKQVAAELFRFVSQEDSEDRLTAVRRMFNHSQFDYVSTIKISLR